MSKYGYFGGSLSTSNSAWLLALLLRNHVHDAGGLTFAEVHLDHLRLDLVVAFARVHELIDNDLFI